MIQVGACVVYLCCGIWGTICVGLFENDHGYDALQDEE